MRKLPRVLIVEDEPAIAELIAVNLRHNGFQPFWAEDGDSAQRELDAVLPDVILLDWMLPGQSGLSLARKWWGADVTSPASGESASEVIDGNVRMAFVHLCPQATVVSIAMEVGTQVQTQVMLALFADNWLYQKGEPHSSQGLAIRQQVRDAFFVDTPEWREKAMTRAMTIWQDALTGMNTTTV